MVALQWGRRCPSPIAEQRAGVGNKMKRIFIGSFLTVALALPAVGADLPARTYTKAPTMVAAAYNWTGFYVGVDAGGAWERDSGTTNFFQTFAGIAPFLIDNPQTNSFRSASFIGGVHAGYNWQMSKWVLGIEADWDWTNPKNSFCRQTDVQSLPCADAPPGRGFLTLNEKTQWLASARGRVGYAWDRFMIYGTGGVAWGKIDTSINANCVLGGCGASVTLLNITGNFSDTKVGWVAGAGVEAMLDANWIVRAEYLHYDLGNVTDTFGFNGISPGGLPEPQSATWSRRFTYDTVRAGLSYKFGGPVIAKY